MKKIDLKIIDKRIGKDFPLPHQATLGSAGIDLYACIDQVTNLLPSCTIKIPAGIAIHIANKKIAAIILPRSGLGHRGIVLGNMIGLIDSDYQGQIFISIWNRSKKKFIIYPGDRLAQLLFVPIIKVKFNVVKNFKDVSQRNSKGFGHTGGYK